MDITVTEIMELADMHAYAKITECSSAELLPRNLLERKIQQIVSHIADLEVRVWQCGAGANCCAQATRIEELEAQLEAVGAGGVGPLRKRCLHQISESQAQPVAWAIFAENGLCRMWTQNKGHADVAAKDTGLPLTALYATPQPVAQTQDALVIAEAALADIGDADHEPNDDLAWCEARAAQALPMVRAAIAAQQGDKP